MDKEKKIFFLIDMSSSIKHDLSNIGKINDVLRHCLSVCNDYLVEVIGYASGSKSIFCCSSVDINQPCWNDLNVTDFDGRSDLGSAYCLVEKLIKNNKLQKKDCLIVLITDEDATDDYLSCHKNFDKLYKTHRAVFSLNSQNKGILRVHSNAINNIFTDKDSLSDYIVSVLE